MNEPPDDVRTGGSFFTRDAQPSGDQRRSCSGSRLSDRRHLHLDVKRFAEVNRRRYQNIGACRRVSSGVFNVNAARARSTIFGFTAFTSATVSLTASGEK